MMRTLLDDDEVVVLAQKFPGFGKLRSEQFSKGRSDSNVRKIIAISPDFCPIARVITVLGMVKRLFHKPGERLRAAFTNFSPNELDELSFQSEKVERPTPNVQCRNAAV